MVNINKKSFNIYKDSLNVLDGLTDEEAGKLFKAIKLYQTTGKIELTGLLKAVLIPFITKFEIDEEKYEKTCEKNRKNGKKGGAPKKNIEEEKPKQTQNNPVGFLETQTNPNEPDTDTDTDTDTDNDIDNVVVEEQSSKIIELRVKENQKNFYGCNKNVFLNEKRYEDLKSYAYNSLKGIDDLNEAIDELSDKIIVENDKYKPYDARNEDCHYVWLKKFLKQKRHRYMTTPLNEEKKNEEKTTYQFGF